MMDNWHKMRKAIVPGHAQKDAEKLLDSYGLDYDPAQWPFILSQLVGGILRPTEFDVMPEGLMDVKVHLHINEPFINKQIDLPPQLLDLLLMGGAWEDLLTTCLSSPGAEVDVTTDDRLPFIAFPNEDRPDMTEPDEKVFFFRADLHGQSQVIMVYVGRLDFEWFYRNECTTGEVSRLQLLVSRYQPRIRSPWVQLVPGSQLFLRMNASSDDGEFAPQVHNQESNRPKPELVDMNDVLHRPHLFQGTEEYLPRDSRNPTATYWRQSKLDPKGYVSLPQIGPHQPGFFHRPRGSPSLVSATLDPTTAQCLKPWYKVVQEGMFEVEIVSEMVNISGRPEDFATCLKRSLNFLHNISDYSPDYSSQFEDPQTLCSQVYKVLYRIIEHVLFNANRRLQYSTVFDDNWVTVSKGSKGQASSNAVFLLPYPGGRAQMVAKAEIVVTGNCLVRMAISLMEVSTCGPFHSHPTTENTLHLEMFGAPGVTMLRECINSVSSGDSKEETRNTRLNLTDQRVVEVDPKRKNDWPTKSDQGDMRNFEETVKVLLTAVTGKACHVRTSQQPTAERLSSELGYVVRQRVVFTAMFSGETSQEIFVALDRVLKDRSRRPHWPQGRLGRMTPHAVELTMKVSSGQDSSWPSERQSNSFGLETIAIHYMGENNLYIGKCKNLLHMFAYGGNVLLSSTEGSHWERYFYLEIWDKLDIHVLDLVRFLSLIMGSSALDCAVQRTNEPNKLIWAGEVKGEQSVPDKRIRISMFPEKHRHSGCGKGGRGEELAFPLLTLEIQVDLDDMALAPVCFKFSQTSSIFGSEF